MLLYRGFDIGSAKPTAEERASVVHHLVDILEAEESFSVTDFVAHARRLIPLHEAAGKIPFIVGGTGLYIKALIEGYDFNATPGSQRFRARMHRLAACRGNVFVHALLARRDPETAARLHPNNVRRVIRALETFYCGGERISQDSAHRKGETVYDAFVIGLVRERAHLYERINARVDAMFAAGLVDEVRRLLASGVGRDAPAMKGIGYKETAAYLAGEMRLEETIEQIKTATRHFAKRQMTWYRKMTAKIINLQDGFLNQVRKDSVPVIIHLVNGFQIKGVVKGFDNFIVMVDSMGKQQMIYKHAISTITPSATVKVPIE